MIRPLLHNFWSKRFAFAVAATIAGIVVAVIGLWLAVSLSTTTAGSVAMLLALAGGLIWAFAQVVGVIRDLRWYLTWSPGSPLRMESAEFRTTLGERDTPWGLVAASRTAREEHLLAPGIDNEQTLRELLGLSRIAPRAITGAVSSGRLDGAKISGWLSTLSNRQLKRFSTAGVDLREELGPALARLRARRHEPRRAHRFTRWADDAIEKPTIDAFITWAHDHRGFTEDAWKRHVGAFAAALARLGVDVEIDLKRQGAPWSSYGTRRIEIASHVLLVASSAYKESWQETGDPTKRAGSAREAYALKGLFELDREALRNRLTVVLLPGVERTDIPIDLLSYVEHHPVPSFDPAGLEPLLRALTRQNRWRFPPTGELPDLPPEVL
jgi:hypothetical protein